MRGGVFASSKKYTTAPMACLLVNLVLETRSFGGVGLQLIHSMRQVCHDPSLLLKLRLGNS
jgi:hypothetical protein